METRFAFRIQESNPIRRRAAFGDSGAPGFHRATAILASNNASAPDLILAQGERMDG